MTETDNTHTNELLLASQRNCLKELQEPPFNSLELMTTIHQEIKTVPADRKYLLEKVLNALEEVSKANQNYRHKLTVLEYHIHQVRHSGV